MDHFITKQLEALDAHHCLRSPISTMAEEGMYVMRQGQRLLSFASNDYLGLSRDHRLVEAAKTALDKYGLGAGASRLISGQHLLYDVLHAKLAMVKGTEAATVFGSGYLANIGVIPAFVGRGDLVISDRLIHASLIDGIRLSGAKHLRFTHNDVDHAARLIAAHRQEYERCLIVTDHVFSMDGDIAPVAALKTLAESNDAWLMTDDAHGLAVLDQGKERAHIQMGTLSKALGCYGGYVCGSAKMMAYLESTARSLIYTTALPPSILAAAIKALEIILQEPVLCQTPLKLAQYFTDMLGVPKAQSPIVSLVLGSENAALDAAKKLQVAGFYVSAIRPPTVPQGSSRLRLTFSALHSTDQVASLAQAIKGALAWHQ